MADLQRIDELTAPPIIGQRYLVPTVNYEWCGLFSAWPVMGPKHSDIEHLHFGWEHYHIDIRFITRKQAAKMNRQYDWLGAKMKGPLTAPVALAAATAPLHKVGGPPLPESIYRRRTCVQPWHAYPINHAIEHPRFAAMHAAYSGRRCARNAAGLLICPHKGFALDTLIPDERGRVVCPLHGLIIDVRAGVVVRHDALSVPTPASAEAV